MAHRDEKRTGNRAAKCTGRLQPIALPRQSPTLHRHGVSKNVFAAVDSHAWWRLVSWLRRKHKRKRSRIGMKEVRRRFCDRGWRLAHNGTVFTGAASVKVTRYRYRGDRIPTPWATRPAASNS